MIKGLVDKHAAVKLRATDAPALFDYAFRAVQGLFNSVESHDPTKRAAEHDSLDQEAQEQNQAPGQPVVAF